MLNPRVEETWGPCKRDAGYGPKIPGTLLQNLTIIL